MKILVKNFINLILLIFTLNSCRNSDVIDQSATVPISIVDFQNQTINPEGYYVDGVKTYHNNDSNIFLVFQETNPFTSNLESSIELYSNSSSLLKIKRTNDSLSKEKVHLLYLANTLKTDFINDKSFICFFYMEKQMVQGQDPIKINMCTYYSGETIIVEGIFPTHPDWEWEDYYKNNLEETTSKLPTELNIKLSKNWNQFALKFKKNIYSF